MQKLAAAVVALRRISIFQRSNIGRHHLLASTPPGVACRRRLTSAHIGPTLPAFQPGAASGRRSGEPRSFSRLTLAFFLPFRIFPCYPDPSHRQNDERCRRTHLDIFLSVSLVGYFV